MLRNLLAEMKRYGVTAKDIGEALDITEKTVRNKIYGRSDFTFPEAEIIRDTFFPKMELDYLFASSEVSLNTGA